MSNVDAFHVQHTQLTDWLEVNRQDIEKSPQLATLSATTQQLKSLRSAGIDLQPNFESLDKQLDDIDATVQEFRRMTDTTDDTAIYTTELFRQSVKQLSDRYADFLKDSQEIIDQCDHCSSIVQRATHLRDDFLTSMGSFDEKLAMNDKVIGDWRKISASLFSSPFFSLEQKKQTN